MREFEEKNEMHYVTSAERLGMKKGFKRGQLELLNILLTHKFGHIPAAYTSRINDATPEQIPGLCKKLLTANSIDEFFN